MAAILFPPAQSNLDGVQVTGTPSAGQALEATSATAATWKTLFVSGELLCVPTSYAPNSQVLLTTTSQSFAALNVAATTVASGSNGGEISAIASWSSPSAGVLDVATTTGWPSSGTVNVAASGATTAVVTYTGTAAGQLTGCAYVSGSPTGTVATGGAVTLTSVSLNTGSFTAPASGSVIVGATFVGGINANAGFAFGLAAHGTVTPMVCNNIIFDQSAGSLNPGPYQLDFMVSSLTPGTSYNFDLLACVTSGDTLTVEAMGNTSTSPTLTSGGRGAPVLITVQAI